MKISIIIPVYNVENYLVQCLESIVNQTLKDIEIICVDDCSTDASYEILQNYSNKDSRIKLLKTKTNSGPGIARNNALSIAQGEYVMFVDPDDWIDLRACEILYSQADNNGNDLVIFNYFEYIENRKKIKKVKRTSSFKGCFNKNNFDIKSLNYNFFISTFLCFQLYSNKLIQTYDIKFSEHRFCEDDIFVIKAFLNSTNASICEDFLYYYRIQKDSLMHCSDLYLNVIETKIDCYEYILKFCNLNNLTKPLHYYIDYLVNSLLYYLQCYINQNPFKIKNYYTSVRNIFIMLENKYPKYILKTISKYKIYKKIIGKNWLCYLLQFYLQKLFFIGNTPDKNHKLLIFAGIKCKFKNK